MIIPENNNTINLTQVVEKEEPVELETIWQE
jgi:hypothetical protein